MQPFLTPAEAEAINERARELEDEITGGAMGWALLGLECLKQALEEHTIKPGSAAFCRPKGCKFLRYAMAIPERESCVHPGFDGEHCPLEKKEEKCL